MSVYSLPGPSPKGRRLGHNPCLQAILRYAVVVLGYALLFSLWQYQPVPLTVYLAGILVAAIAFFPIAYWSCSGRQRLPVFEITCISFGLQYSVPLYTQPNAAGVGNAGGVALNWVVTQSALLLAALGLSAMIAAYYLARSSPLVRSLPGLQLTPRGGRLSKYLLTVFIGGAGLTALTGLGGLQGGLLSNVSTILAKQSLAGVALLAYCVYDGRLPGWRPRLALGAWIALLFLLGMGTGLLENAFVPLVVILVVMWHARGHLPWRLLAAGVIAFFLFNSAKAQYRTEAWYSQAPSGPLGRVAAWQQATGAVIANLTTGDLPNNAQAMVWQATQRLDLLHQLAWVDAMTPGQVPYLDGATYSYLPISWVPRIVWPDKPIVNANNTLAARYGYYSAQIGNGTTIGFGEVAEGYANLGTLMVLIVLALQGLLFAAADQMFNSRNDRGAQAAYLPAALYFLNGIGGAAAPLVAGFVQQVAVSAAILRAFDAIPERRGRSGLGSLEGTRGRYHGGAKLAAKNGGPS